jgi:hypothetical protein
MMIPKVVRETGKKLFLAVHKAGARTGLIILPNHYYIGVPDVVSLAATTDQWARRSTMPDGQSDISQQAKTMRKMCSPFEEEYRGNVHFRKASLQHFGPGYGYIEAQALHGVIRSLKPARVIEVGSGVSTYCMLQALSLNSNQYDLTCIEPNPSAWLRSSKVNLIDRPVQWVSRDFFMSLDSGDFLFIDSSHTVKTGGDVNYLILEILPVLRPGVVVHFHDITLPYDYSPDTLQSFIHPQETSLLRAFLVGNRRFQIVFCMSQIHHDLPEALKQTFPEYRPEEMRNGLWIDRRRGHFPSSLYLRVC